jgi:CDP-diacylglycerol--serine O-phosphatidyltransferase
MDPDLDESTLPSPPQRPRRRGVYLLPNLLTTGTLFGGFYGIVAAIDGLFLQAAVGVFLAGVLDGLDGRVARLTHTQSDFGREYDSLADMVSFGLAPALIVYLWGLRELVYFGWHWGQVGWLAAFVYAVGAALRLARFNTQSSDISRRYFVGLPSPAAAAVVTGLVWVCADSGISGVSMSIPAALVTASAGALMVSSIRFYSFKEIKLAEPVPFRYLLIMVGGVILIAFKPPLVLFLCFFGYMLTGVVQAVLRRRRRKNHSPIDQG